MNFVRIPFFWRRMLQSRAWAMRVFDRRAGIQAFLFLLIMIGVGLIKDSPVLSQTAEQSHEQLLDIAGVKKTHEKKTRRVEVGDKLRVTIYPSDEYIKGGEMEVSSEGTITLSMLGKIQVEGKKVVEVEQEISGRLAKDYLVSPIVVIEVAPSVGAEKEKKSVAILGQVKTPASYDIPNEGKMTLLQLISKAGGFTDVANVKKIKIVRKQGNKTQVIRANAESIISGKDPDVILQADDVVHVGESFF